MEGSNNGIETFTSPFISLLAHIVHIYNALPSLSDGTTYEKVKEQWLMFECWGIVEMGILIKLKNFRGNPVFKRRIFNWIIK